MKLFRALILFLSLIFTMQLSAYAQQPTSATDPNQYFNVSGSAEIRVKPDRVNITVGIYERTTDLQAARDKMNRTITAIIDFARKNGITEKYIQTTNIRISPEYPDARNSEQNQNYYIVQQSLTITLTEVDKYNQIIYGVLDLGADTIDDIRFWSSEYKKKYQDQARLDAIQAAKERATLLTGAVGIKLGNIVNITEGEHPQYYASGGAANYARYSEDYSLSSVVGAGEIGSAAGTISIKSTISLTYKILN